MKKILSFSAAILCCATLAFSQAPAYKMQVGDQLVYRVEAGQNEYDFIVTPTKLSKTGISFNYEMTAPANKKGTITMNEEALTSSMAMYNQFGGGAVNLTDQVSVFASKAMMDAASEGIGEFMVYGPQRDGQSFLTLDGNTSELNGSTYLKVVKTVAGKDYSFDGPILENEDGSEAIRFADGGEFPFIIYMVTNFKVYLTEVRRGK